MQCPHCRQENPPQAKFCLECGARLVLTCAHCGTELPAGAKFCFECGQPVRAQPTTPLQFTVPATYTPTHLAEKILTSRNALEGERKHITVLFADLKASMELLADRDPEEARRLLDPVLERMMAAVHRYEGTVNQIMGDGIMALFGAPIAHEDHAVRACYAALAMQAALRSYSDEVWRTHGLAVHFRVGLNSGEVVVRAIGNDLHMDYSAVGQTTHLAARMEQLATPGSSRRQARMRPDVSHLLGVHRNTISCWLAIDAAGGLTALLATYIPGGKPVSLAPAVLTSLEQALHRPAGLASDEALRQWVRRAIPTANTRPVHIFSQDENRFGLLTVRCRRLTASGVQLVGTVQHAFEWFYVDGVVGPTTGDRFFMELPYLNAEMFQLFVDVFAQAFRDSLNLLLLDNSGAHTAQRLTMPENVRLVFLPPYCPELNPIERVWRDLKDALAWLQFPHLDG
jgi:class 3 adenylate cyclase